MSDTTVDASTDGTAAPTDASSGKTAEWYESELTKVRNEAAGYRVGKNEAVKAAKAEVAAEWETKLSQATTEHDATRAQLAKAELDNVKLRAALPADQADTVTKFASLLQGSTEEEIQAHAEEVRTLFGANQSRVPAVDPTPTGKPLALNDDDGLLSALKGAVGIN